jgi:SAM-dependent methyltransferase
MTPADHSLPDHVQRNRTYWDRWATDFATWAPKEWASDEIHWGQYHVPETELGALPERLDGLGVIELGCGTAYVSAWLARRGARPVGIDNSPEQLATARKMQVQFGLDFPLHLGNAEELPFPDASLDLAVSEYGASIWCDPYAWIPEAARVLRPDGHLVYLVNGLLSLLCTPVDATVDVMASERLERPLFGMHRIEWPDDESVEFHLPHGEMIRLLRETGFEIEALIEIQAPEGTQRTHMSVTNEWAQQWPSEEIWRVRKR